MIRRTEGTPRSTRTSKSVSSIKKCLGFLVEVGGWIAALGERASYSDEDNLWV
jgi:hypothetical protein